jgi:hypothetical protein
MEYLAKYISESSAEIIKCPDNPEDSLETERAKLLEIINTETETEAENETKIEQIKIQSHIVKNLQNQVEKYAQIIDEGFVEFVYSNEPETTEGQILELSYSLIEGKVYQNWTVVVDKKYYENQVQVLKKDLESSDYKIIKCYESNLLGVTLPYNITELISERQAIRDDINDIEIFIANL